MFHCRLVAHRGEKKAGKTSGGGTACAVGLFLHKSVRCPTDAAKRRSYHPSAAKMRLRRSDVGRLCAPIPIIFPSGLAAGRREVIMSTHIIVLPCWSTASFGDTADTSPLELSALGEHLDLCKALTGRLFPVQCVAEGMHAFVAARFVTTLVVIALVFGVGSLMS
jgi:hypothetical protein